MGYTSSSKKGYGSSSSNSNSYDTSSDEVYGTGRAFGSLCPTGGNCRVCTRLCMRTA